LSARIALGVSVFMSEDAYWLNDMAFSVKIIKCEEEIGEDAS
jgi:hypothetical protein